MFVEEERRTTEQALYFCLTQVPQCPWFLALPLQGEDFLPLPMVPPSPLVQRGDSLSIFKTASLKNTSSASTSSEAMLRSQSWAKIFQGASIWQSTQRQHASATATAHYSQVPVHLPQYPYGDFRSLNFAPRLTNIQSELGGLFKPAQRLHHLQHTGPEERLPAGTPWWSQQSQRLLSSPPLASLSSSACAWALHGNNFLEVHGTDLQRLDIIFIYIDDILVANKSQQAGLSIHSFQKNAMFLRSFAFFSK